MGVWDENTIVKFLSLAITKKENAEMTTFAKLQSIDEKKPQATQREKREWKVLYEQYIII